MMSQLKEFLLIFCLLIYLISLHHTLSAVCIHNNDSYLECIHKKAQVYISITRKIRPGGWLPRSNRPTHIHTHTKTAHNIFAVKKKKFSMP